MNSYKVTIISPAGFRDVFYTNAKSEGHARIQVAQEILVSHPNWRAVSAVRA